MDASVYISAVALLVAVYGIFERQRAAYSALRVRLTELLSTIEDLNIEDLRYRNETAAKGAEPSASWIDSAAQAEAAAGYASRRTLLTYQAVDLLNRLRKSRLGRTSRITPVEYCSLATSLRWCGDDDLAIEHFRAALSPMSGFVPHAVLDASAVGLGETLFDHQRTDEGREVFQTAAGRPTEATFAGVSARFFVCMRWLACEKRVPKGKPEIPVRIAHELAREINWDPEFMHALQQACTDTIYVNGEYAEVGLADLLEHSMDELLAGAARAGEEDRSR